MLFFENFMWLLVLIGIMIIIHELGHFIAARLFDVRVETFSLGFGPRLFGFKWGETDFRFSAILFGGYVKMAGEQPGESDVDDPHSFQAKPRWQRLIVAAAGPFMNIVLAIGLLTSLFMYQYPKPLDSTDGAVVGYVVNDSAAKKAGVQAGDRIAAVAGIPNPTWEDIVMKVVMNPQQSLPVKIQRDGDIINTHITPALDEKQGIGFAGWGPQMQVQVASVSPGTPADKAGLKPGDLLVSINGQSILALDKLTEIVKNSDGSQVELRYERVGELRQASVQPELIEYNGEKRYMIGISMEHRVEMVELPFPQALAEAVNVNVRTAGLIGQMLSGIVQQRMSAKSLEGPIRIAQISGDAARQGSTQFLSLMAMVSLNLAIFNLLPIPVLDGGLILLLLIEMFMRRDLSLKVKETVFKLGFVFLMAVVVFVLYNDITKTL